MTKRVYAVKEVKKLLGRVADSQAASAMGGGATLTTQAHALDGPEHTHKGEIASPWSLIAGGILSPTPGAVPAGEIVVQVKTTAGAPTHAASEGTPCWVAPDNTLYVNNNGATAWTLIGTPTIALDDLTDVVITAAAVKQVLRYTGATWVNAILAASDLSTHMEPHVAYDGTVVLDGNGDPVMVEVAN